MSRCCCKKLLWCYINTYLKYSVLCTFFPPATSSCHVPSALSHLHASCSLWKNNRDQPCWQTQRQSLCFVHLKAVFVFTAAAHAASFSFLFFCTGPESHFLRFSPSFLSEKSEVICKPRPSQPTRVRAAVSCQDGGPENTSAHVVGFWRKAAEIIKSYWKDGSFSFEASCLCREGRTGLSALCAARARSWSGFVDRNCNPNVCLQFWNICSWLASLPLL